ncbi:haloacid dehalogenase [Halobacteriales archaeon SW_7_65_23]|nr:MAG: haloacid dehalogenase [Halobacteriales archaeon SW_7_65_23]
MTDGTPWKGIEAVLFDLDHTLVEYRRTSGELLAASFEACDLEPLFPVGAYYERFDDLREEHDSIEALRAACFAELAAERGHDPDLGRQVAAAYSEMRDQTNVAFVDGARTVLVYAGEEVPAKPAIAPFERALDRLDAEPESTIHVGDSLSSDVAGANAAGLRSVWLADTDNPTGADGAAEHAPAHRINAIDELLPLLGVE